MKKVLSLVLVLAMVLGMMPVFAAGETGADQLYKYGFISGNNGDLMVNKELTRAEMAVLVAEMNGLKEEAANYAAPADFSDVEAGKWYTPYVAYGQANGWWAGYPDGTFKPEIGMSGQEFASVLMKALNYDVTWNTVLADAAAVGVKVESTSNLTRGAAFDSMWATVNTPAKGEEVALGVKLGRLESAMVTDGPLAVDTVTANTAKSFEVKFKNVVADTTKVTFDVKRETTKATVTVAWNEAKTAATLAASAKLAEGNYEIVVNDATGTTPVALGTFKVTIEKEKVASIEFGSDTLQRYSDIQGFVSYKVLNQYGEEVTDASLGRGLTWSTSTVGGTDAKKKPIDAIKVDEKTGVIKVAQGDATTYNSQLRTYDTVVITARDDSAGFVVTKNFKVSDTINAVSEIKINGIVNEKGEAVDFAYSTTKTYYVDYTALDAFGNEISSYDILGTEVTTGNPLLNITGSTSYFDVEPEDRDGVMAYKVTFDSNNKPNYDTPVTFMAIASQGGKNATATVTLKKEVSLEKFVLRSPAETVSSKKEIEFPFEAFDQNGNAVTDYDDFFDGTECKVNFGSENWDKTNQVGLHFVRQSDGSAKLMGRFVNENNANGINKYVNATVKDSSKPSPSPVSFTVKMAAHPDSIKALTHSYAFTDGATWKRNVSKFKVQDQYDRDMNLRSVSDTISKGYKIRVTSNNTKAIDLSGGTEISNANNKKTVQISGADEVTFAGKASGASVTVTYELGYYDEQVYPDQDADAVDEWVSVDTATTTVYNVERADITGAVLEDVEGEKVFMTNRGPAYATLIDNEPTLRGKTSNGTLVRLPDDMIGSTAADKVGAFTVSDGRFTRSADGEKIFASGDFGSTDNITATVTGLLIGTQAVYTDTATLTASSELPVTSGVYVEYKDMDQYNNLYSVNSDVVTISLSDLATVLNGKTMNGNGVTGVTTSEIHFLANTQYGDDTGIFNSFTAVPTSENNKGTLTINSTNGVVDTSAVQSGDEYQITAVSGAHYQAIVIQVK